MPPAQMRALVIQQDRSVKVEERPVPKISPTQFLLRVTVLGQNPTDFKSVSFNPIGARVGSDCVGIVEEVGQDVPSGKITKGERRAVLTRPNQERGAFAEYIAVEYDAESWLVPDAVTDEQAATTPVPFFTAVLGLFGERKLGVPQPPRDGGRGSASGTIFVHSGATSVGTYVIQLAKLAGLRVIATSSPKNFELLKRLGADQTVSYRDADYVEQIKKLSGGGVDYAYDTYTEGGALEKTLQTLKPSGRATCILPYDPSQYGDRAQQLAATMVYHMTSKTSASASTDFRGLHIDADPAIYDLFIDWTQRLHDLGAAGKLQWIKTVNSGGLDDVQAGLERMKSGGISAEKLVYRV